MLGVLILKIKYKYKAKGNEDKELCFIKKVTNLEFRDTYDEWYIIPTISISFNNGIDIAFHWFKVYYASFWSVVTFEDENEYAEFIQYKNNKNELSCL